MPCDSSHLHPTEREQESRDVAQFIDYVIGTGEFEGWYNPVEVSKYIGVGDEAYGDVNLLDEMTAFLCSLCNHMNEPMKDRIIYNGREKIARRLADWWEKHEKVDGVRGLVTEETEEMKFLSQFLDLGDGKAVTVREFLEVFLRVMHEEEHSMSYLEAMQNVIKLCRNKENSNGS